MRRKARNPAQRMRLAVEAMPRRTRLAMLRGIHDNDIIAGGYADKELGGICPMLAAHRNGGRTNQASFARAWDRFTGARRPRLATTRELGALHSYLELSLLAEERDDRSVAALAGRIHAEGTAEAPPDTGERHRALELRLRPRWAWLMPARRYDVFADRVAAADEQYAERRVADGSVRVTPPGLREGSLPSG